MSISVFHVNHGKDYYESCLDGARWHFTDEKSKQAAYQMAQDHNAGIAMRCQKNWADP